MTPGADVSKRGTPLVKGHFDENIMDVDGVIKRS
jgi:hypothetical protein